MFVEPPPFFLKHFDPLRTKNKKGRNKPRDVTPKQKKQTKKTQIEGTNTTRPLEQPNIYRRIPKR